jgi:hypothetical protein
VSSGDKMGLKPSVPFEYQLIFIDNLICKVSLLTSGNLLAYNKKDDDLGEFGKVCELSVKFWRNYVNFPL